MTPSRALPLAILLLGAALPAAAYAQADVPVPTASPEAPAADSGEAVGTGTSACA